MDYTRGGGGKLFLYGPIDFPSKIYAGRTIAIFTCPRGHGTLRRPICCRTLFIIPTGFYFFIFLFLFFVVSVTRTFVNATRFCKLYALRKSVDPHNSGNGVVIASFF